MRTIKLNTKEVILSDDVECFYEKMVTPFGTSAKLDVPLKFRGRRAYVIIMKK
jgi:putative transposon-encoded protein